jgi:hypothetical protein
MHDPSTFSDLFKKIEKIYKPSQDRPLVKGGRYGLRKQYFPSCKSVGKNLGVSDTFVRDCAFIIDSGRENIKEQVRAGKYSVSTAVRLIKMESQDATAHTNQEAAETDTANLTIQRARLMLDIELLAKQKDELETFVKNNKPTKIGFFKRLFWR